MQHQEGNISSSSSTTSMLENPSVASKDWQPTSCNRDHYLNWPNKRKMLVYIYWYVHKLSENLFDSWIQLREAAIAPGNLSIFCCSDLDLQQEMPPEERGIPLTDRKFRLFFFFSFKKFLSFILLFFCWN